MITLTDTQATIALLAAVSNVIVALTGLIVSVRGGNQSYRNAVAIQGVQTQTQQTAQAVQDVHDCLDEHHLAMTTAVTAAANAAKEASIATTVAIEKTGV